MDAHDWQHAQGLFHAAVDLGPDEQAAFLAAAARDDPTLATELAAMLQSDRQGHDLIDGGLEQTAVHLFGRDGLPPDGAFGRYRVTSFLGEGGMGVVYKAQRDDLGSTVAIKVLRDAWLSPSRRSRFVGEQRTLAQLSHPSIAALYDADALSDGTPWFVMEYVEGEPITAFCRAHLPSLDGRLTLFRSVCAAVQHAHERLVVHRDLKPSNILVKSDGSVKLLDFGIARQLDEHARPADRTMTGFRLMTPAYASPEQMRGEAPGVDTDVYSLGVVLYELLTGQLPYELEGRSAAEATRLVLEYQPERPSRVVARAPRHRQPPDAPSGGAWADLDVLCLTAMHKDPRRRYRTVDALIRDIDHFRRGEPLEARPDTLVYRGGKFVRRNSLPLSIAASAAGTLVGMAAWYTVRLRTARNAALAEAARAQRIQQFMLALFEGGDTDAGPSDDLRVITLIDRGVQGADALSHEPVAQAELYQTLGRLYQKQGRFDQADALFARALERRRHLFDEDSAEVADTTLAIADLRTDQARYDDAEKLAREALASTERALPAQHPLRAVATRSLGRVLQERGAYDDAVPVLERAIAQLDTGSDTVELADSLHELANVHFYAGRYGESDALNQRALAIYRRVFGPAHPHVGDTLINLGAIMFERGDDAQAERLYREGLAITEAWYGPEHFRTANNLVMLGRTLTRREKLDEASAVLSRALAGRERAYGVEHPNVASVLNELGTIARKQGRLDDAEAAYRRMAGIYRAVHGDRAHFLSGVAASNLGSVAQLRGDYEEAARLLLEAIEIFVRTQGAEHSNTAIARVKLAAALLAGGRIDEALREAQTGYSALQGTMSPESFWLIEARTTLEKVEGRG
jgi:serine/threonine-protein kinase